MGEFELHPRLQQDTLPVGDFPLCRLLLLSDSRFPWLLLVPRKAGLEEIHQLAAADRHQLADETAQVSEILLQLTGARKINTGALGNIVSQLHIHVVARFESDAAWPGPVWGAGAAEPYGVADAAKFVAAIKTATGAVGIPA